MSPVVFDSVRATLNMGAHLHLLRVGWGNRHSFLSDFNHGELGGFHRQHYQQITVVCICLVGTKRKLFSKFITETITTIIG